MHRSRPAHRLPERPLCLHGQRSNRPKGDDRSRVIPLLSGPASARILDPITRNRGPTCGGIRSYPAEIRKVIYATNAIESVNMTFRKVTKSRGAFQNDDALIKLYYLAIRNISKKWTMPVQNWKAALKRFTIMFDERMLKQ